MSLEIPSLAPLPRFDVQIPPPDLTCWLGGNTDTPGVWTFTAPVAGPHLTLVSLVHGNEFAGAIVLDSLLHSGVRPACGTLTLIFANMAAFQRFNPQSPTASRFIDEDMNRIWSPHLLDGNSQTAEITRARALRSVIEQADILLDLHTMLADSTPLILCGSGTKGRVLSQALAPPHLIVADHGHAGGNRLIDYPLVQSDTTQQTAILIEAGSHWSPEAVDITTDMVARVGAFCGVLPALTPAPRAPVHQAEVTHTITPQGSDFAFVQPWKNLDNIPQRNTLLAMDGDTEIRTPYDNCILVMPTLRPSRNHTAVRLARLV